MAMAIVVMVVVILVVGGVGFAALSVTSSSGTSTISSCSPMSSPVCLSSSGLTDVMLSVPDGAGFGQAVASTTQGQSIPATVAVSGGESVSMYAVYWGDGSNYSGANPISNHIYSTMGWYVISAQALVGSAWHTGPKYLYPIEVGPNYQTSSSGFYPTIATTFTNGSSATTQFGWLSGSGSVMVSAKYTANSTATGYTDNQPTLTITPAAGTTQSNLASTGDERLLDVFILDGGSLLHLDGRRGERPAERGALRELHLDGLCGPGRYFSGLRELLELDRSLGDQSASGRDHQRGGRSGRSGHRGPVNRV